MMAYPPGFLFPPSVSLALHSCPSFGSSVMLGPRTEELGRSSSGSAFAPYAGSATFNSSSSSSSPGFNAHGLPYGGEPRAAATLNSFVGPAYDSSAMTGSLDYHSFSGALGAYPYGDPAYRKNATRDATTTLKAWLNEHRKNPYPTKGEKIMLAIITKMTLTQVSTWFANARRRLKKENKMTWTPRTRSEDEEEDDNIDLERNDDDEEPIKPTTDQLESNNIEAAGPNPAAPTADQTHKEKSHETQCGLAEADFKDPGDRRLFPVGPVPATCLSSASARSGTHHGVSGSESESGRAPCSPTHPKRLGGEAGRGVSCSSNASPAAPKPPKLWSLAEIATSSDHKCKGSIDTTSATTTSTRTLQFPPHVAPLSRRLYYSSPFIPPRYSNYGTFGHLHGSNMGPTATHLNGLHQTLLQRAEAIARDCKLRQSPTQLDIGRELTQHQVKKGLAHV